MAGTYSLIFLFLFLVLALILLLYILLKISSLSFSGVPYIQIPEEVLPAIIKALNLKDNSTLYDLGSGDARVLMAGYRAMPTAQYVGIEHSILPVLISRSKIKHCCPNGGISIVRGSFFKENLSGATHIFMYLSPIVNDILPKLEVELKPGTRVVTCDYPFGSKRPTQVIDLNRPAGSLARTLYVYVF